jgi:uncharacterized surface protein with fasciclin (FAS1) repeats
VAVAIVTAGVVTAVVLRDDAERSGSAEPAASPMVPTTVTVTTTTTPAASSGPGVASPADETIVDIAARNPDLSTLVELVTYAGLGETLSGEGPFTVFAPTNSAFADLDPGTSAALKADPQGALTEVLKLHVISGKVDAAAATAAAGTCVETLGGKVKIEKPGDSLTVGGAPIVSTDIMGSNGIIHVIDGVITASSEGC